MIQKYYHHNTEVHHAALKEALNMVPSITEENDMARLTNGSDEEYQLFMEQEKK